MARRAAPSMRQGTHTEPAAQSRTEVANVLDWATVRQRRMRGAPALQPKAGAALQPKFDLDGAWMQGVDDTELLAKFTSTTSALWKALRDDKHEIGVRHDASGANYSFSSQIISISSDWLGWVKDYVKSGTQNPKLTRAIAALTHEMSHAHDHMIRKESPAGASRDGDDWVLGVLKTELRAWMKEARSGREHAREKKLGSTDDDNDLIFSWVALKYMLDDNVALEAKSNVVLGRLQKYYNDNKTDGKSSSLAVLVRDHLRALMIDYAGQVRAKFASDDATMRGLAAKYMK